MKDFFVEKKINQGNVSDYDIAVLKTMYVLRADREGHASTAAAARIHSANVQAVENVVLPGKMIIVLGMGGKEVDGSMLNCCPVVFNPVSSEKIHRSGAEKFRVEDAAKASQSPCIQTHDLPHQLE